jgi:hypothetical protein
MNDLVTAEIEGYLEPIQVPLDRALDMLWTTLRALPIGNLQYGAFGHFFGVGVEGRVQDAIEQDGRLQLTFAMEDRLHSLTVTPAVGSRRAR